MHNIFAELQATEFHHHQMNFSGTTTIKIITEKTPPWPGRRHHISDLTEVLKL